MKGAGHVPPKDDEENHDTRANGQRCICAGRKGAHSQPQGRRRKALQRQDPTELCKPAAAANHPASVICKFPCIPGVSAHICQIT